MSKKRVACRCGFGHKFYIDFETKENLKMNDVPVCPKCKAKENKNPSPKKQTLFAVIEVDTIDNKKRYTLRAFANTPETKFRPATKKEVRSITRIFRNRKKYNCGSTKQMTEETKKYIKDLIPQAET